MGNNCLSSEFRRQHKEWKHSKEESPSAFMAPELVVMTDFLEMREVSVFGEIAAGQPTEIVPIDNEQIEVPERILEPRRKLRSAACHRR